jgi:2-oxoglutarate dehydrogenase E1 component
MNRPDWSLNSQSLEYVERLYADYLADPHRVPSAWREYFDRAGGEGEQKGTGNGRAARSLKLGPSFRPASIFNPSPRGNVQTAAPAGVPGGALSADGGEAAKRDLDVARLQDRVDQLVRNYRVRGHMIARFDPLDMPRPPQPELDPKFYGFGPEDLDRPFSTTTLPGPNVQTLRGILERLRGTYCRFIGAQFMHIDNLWVRDWLQRRMEGTQNRLALSRQEQLRILSRLTDAVVFEEFVRKKYVGAKTFSLEGAESLIPLLDLAIEKAASQGVREIVLGMAHRGRLNVLANIIGKPPAEIFREFEDVDPQLHIGRGDVKYHLGHSGDWKTTSGAAVHLSLTFNPSHLEFVNPVVLGRTRAKQDRGGDALGDAGMAVLIHGDAAFAGEGIVQESLNLSQLPGYTVGGTLHIVVNNQIGFTTPPREGRSTTYATDVARMLQCPIFHVNGEDPEAVAQVVNLALDFRQTFHRDVFIDMYCYRRWGHNEGDEPSFTQPLLYSVIERRESVRDSYLDRILLLGAITVDEADRIAEQSRQRLENGLELARGKEFAHSPQTLQGRWQGYHGGPDPPDDNPDTGIPPEQVRELLARLCELPEGFHAHPKLEKFVLEPRREMAQGKRPLDWSAGEALALASAAVDGHRVRLSGQDSCRGTFSHRHAVLYDTKDGRTHMPLAHVSADQAPVEIYNSPLSEAGVLGFDWGYSLDMPEALVIWEAQFGDFWNAAQVIVDQFIASAEEKWRRLSGLVLFLPHGFEGQGPEHSSARLERFLALGADNNLQVVVPTTPAQLFHCLRRQVLRRWRKPLVVLTPKSLLRHPRVVSDAEEFAAGRFQRVLRDASVEPEEVHRVLVCCGKIYYDLWKERQERQHRDVAIVRLEQLYPLPERELEWALKDYQDGTPVFWVQEEPQNMGARPFMQLRFGERLCRRFPFGKISRLPSASPATGSHASHELEQKRILSQAFENGHPRP